VNYTDSDKPGAEQTLHYAGLWVRFLALAADGFMF